MIWVTWRQHRTEAMLAALLLIALVFAIGYSSWDVYALRQSMAGSDQSAALVALSNREGAVLGLVNSFLLAAPLLVGVFIGAPLFARDFEQSTYQLIWTQSVTRRKWLGVTLSLIMAPTILCAGLIGLLATIWVTIQGRLTDPWYYYDEQGLVFVAYSVFALSLGAAVGVLIRRVIPAMAITVAVYVGVRAVVEAFVRPTLIPPFRVPLSSTIPDGSWVQSTAYTDLSGKTMSADQVAQVMRNAGQLRGTVADYLHAHGINSWIYYQPSDRFWTFQAIEASLFIALSCILVAAALVWITRRPT